MAQKLYYLRLRIKLMIVLLRVNSLFHLRKPRLGQTSSVKGGFSEWNNGSTLSYIILNGGTLPGVYIVINIKSKSNVNQM